MSTLFHMSVRLAVNLERTPPTGRILHAGNALTSSEACHLALLLWRAAHELDELVAANTPGSVLDAA